MSKQQTNDNQLLADAKNWFQKKYEKTPQERNVRFIKVWHKPTPLRKTLAVVFAPTEEIGKAFIWEQNVLFRIAKSFLFVGIVFTVFSCAFIYALAQNNKEFMTTITVIAIALCCCALLFLYFLARKCKKAEKIHKWNVEVYYPH